MSRLRKYLWPLGSVAALLIVLLALQTIGLTASRPRDEQTIIEGKSAAETISELRRAGLHGRTVLVLDQRPRIVDRVWQTRTMESLNERSFVPPAHDYDVVSCMIFSGIASEVLFLPPPAVWGEQASRYGERNDSLIEGRGYRVRFYGVPVHLTTEDAVLDRRERLIVYASEGLLGEYDAKFVKQVTSPDRCDVLLLRGEDR